MMTKKTMFPLLKYMVEREAIRLRKENGEAWPWTKDPILHAFKFTNVRRYHDRTTQAFLATYRANRAAPAAVALYNCAVRRFFGTEEFGETVGWLVAHNASTLRRAVERCERPWTGAYMIRAGDAGVPKVEVVAEYLAGVWRQRAAIAQAVVRGSWEAGYRLMHRLYGFGGNGFMAKEVLSDFLLWLEVKDRSLLPADARTWTPAGPGARRGLNRLNGRELLYGFTEAAEPQFIAEIQTLHHWIEPEWKKRMPRDPLGITAHDIQFCLCEFDKYERVRLGEGRPRSRYAPPPPEPPHLRNGIEVA